MAYCTNCGEESSKKICESCGVKRNATHKHCAFCGAELPEKAAICTNCKEPIKGESVIWNIINILISIPLMAMLFMAIGEGQPILVIGCLLLSFLLCLPFIKSVIRKATIGKKGLRKILKLVRVFAVFLFFFIGMGNLQEVEVEHIVYTDNATIETTPSIGSIINKGILQYPASNELYKYNVYDTYVEITEYLGDDSAQEVVVPAEIDGLPVYVVDHNVFDRINVNTIIFEEGIYEIRSKFSGSLVHVVLPSTLKSVNFAMFENCYALESVIIPEGVEFIHSKAFSDCHALKEVTIPSTVSWIDSETFARCMALETVNLSNGLTRIRDNAFVSCYSLKTLILPDTLEEIGYNAFQSSGLTSIEIPASVSKIYCGAFTACESLMEVWVYSQEFELIPQEGLSVALLFSQCPAELVVHGKPASTIAQVCATENIYFEVIK